jgi:hypothetical protein
MIPNDLPALADACPVCPPGEADASLPVGPVTEVNGGRVADYQCSACETAWSAWSDRFGFVHDRLIAPVSPEQAEQHRAAAISPVPRPERRAAA